MKIVGTPGHLERGRTELRREVEHSLERTARMLVAPARPPRRRTRR
ncbi:MAG: hypothetical protein L0221_17950 [Chloroflexi bacterium]|nr:hypothetical protein [Chloroflexota bacterium]